MQLLSIADRLSLFDVVNFGGYAAGSQGDFLRLVARQAGYPDLPIRRVPWSVLRFLGLFNGVVRELLELRYLFDGAVILNGSRLRGLLPDYRDTPIENAVRKTLESYR